MMSVVEYANYYTSRGLALCQIPPGTKGPSEHGWNTAEKAIVGRVDYLNPNHGIGLQHGISRTCAIDVDDLECFELVLGEYGLDTEYTFDKAPRIIGRPGRDKAIFRVPEGVTLTTKKLVWPGKHEGEKPITVVEFRAGSVQDVLPPTIHPDTKKPYEWKPGTECFLDDIPELPHQLLYLWMHWDKFKDQLQAICPWAPVKDIPPATAKRQYTGSRDVDYIGQFNNDNDVESLLKEHGYKRRGNRFLSPSSSSGLAGVVLLDDGKYCYSHHASDPLNDGHKHDAFDLFQTFEHHGDFNSAIRSIAKVYGEKKPEYPTIDISGILNKPKVQDAPTAAFDQNPLADLKFPFSFVDTSEITEIDWVVEDHLEADSLSLIFGEPACGKSLITIDMACSVATGNPWHGHEVKRGLVIYIAGEGFNGLGRRFRAWELHNGVSLKGAPIVRSHKPARLYDRQAAVDVAESVYAVAQYTGMIPSLIVVDTVARNMGGDENSTQDMNAFVEHLDMCLRTPYKAAVVCVHHSGKASPGQARGSTSLRGAIDAEYQIEKSATSDIISMTNKKMKDADAPPEKRFSINKIGLGVQSKKGMEIGSVALSTVDISGVIQQARDAHEHLGKNQHKALLALESLIYVQMKDGIDGPITQDDWREACKEQGMDRSRFREAMAALVSKQKITVSIDGDIRTTREVTVNG